jgi:hypothetical protein
VLCYLREHRLAAETQHGKQAQEHEHAQAPAPFAPLFLDLLVVFTYTGQPFRHKHLAILPFAPAKSKFEQRRKQPAFHRIVDGQDPRLATA